MTAERLRPLLRAGGAILKQPAAQLILGALALISPILYNRVPFLFTDTGTYFQAGYRALYAMIGRRQGASELSDTYLAARSPYYGVPLIAVDALGTIWAVVALQALAAAFALRVLAKAIAPAAAGRTFAALIAALTVGSALPLFVGFAMPDVFGGLALALAAALFVYADRLTWREMSWSWVLLVFSLTLHASHFMAALVLTPLAAAAIWFADPVRGRRAARLGGAALAVTALFVGLYLGLNSISKTPQRAPPFLTARVLADGPGRIYLREACAKEPNRYRLCAFKDRRLDNGDTILWGWDKKTGVYTSSDLPTRIALIAEQPRFVIDVLLHKPASQAVASLANAGEQFIALGLDEGFKIDGRYWLTYPPDFYLRQVIERINGCPEGAKKCVARLPLQAMTVAHIAVVIAAGLYLALALAARARREWRLAEEDARDWKLFWLAAGLILAGLAVNAVVCGVISGPFPRYQARMAWLVPALAILAEARFPLIRRLIPARRADPG
ncbi:MAG: hypothetical protein AB7M12_01675 [Hyphomonadaceae bacterium]